MQNKLARVVNNVETRDHHSVDQMRDLHWLPVRSTIAYYKCVSKRSSVFESCGRYMLGGKGHNVIVMYAYASRYTIAQE